MTDLHMEPIKIDWIEVAERLAVPDVAYRGEGFSLEVLRRAWIVTVQRDLSESLLADYVIPFRIVRPGV